MAGYINEPQFITIMSHDGLHHRPFFHYNREKLWIVMPSIWKIHYTTRTVRNPHPHPPNTYTHTHTNCVQPKHVFKLTHIRRKSLCPTCSTIKYLVLFLPLYKMLCGFHECEMPCRGRTLSVAGTYRKLFRLRLWTKRRIQRHIQLTRRHTAAVAPPRLNGDKRSDCHCQTHNGRYC
jgi:hypothetical protein